MKIGRPFIKKNFHVKQLTTAVSPMVNYVIVSHLKVLFYSKAKLNYITQFNGNRCVTAGQIAIRGFLNTQSTLAMC